MKIAHNPLAFEHLKNENAKLQKAAKQAAQDPLSAQDSDEAQETQKAGKNSEIKELASKNIELIKRANADIGRLQILKNALENLTKNFLSKSAANSQRALKDELEKLMKNASFDGKSVFDFEFKDSKGAVLMSAARAILQNAKDKDELKERVSELENLTDDVAVQILKNALEFAQAIEDEALRGRQKLDLGNIENLMKSELLKGCYTEMDCQAVKRLTS